MKGKLKALWLRVNWRYRMLNFPVAAIQTQILVCEIADVGFKSCKQFHRDVFSKTGSFWNKIVLAFVFYLGFPWPSCFVDFREKAAW